MSDYTVGRFSFSVTSCGRCVYASNNRLPFRLANDICQTPHESVWVFVNISTFADRIRVVHSVFLSPPHIHLNNQNNSTRFNYPVITQTHRSDKHESKFIIRNLVCLFIFSSISTIMMSDQGPHIGSIVLFGFMFKKLMKYFVFHVIQYYYRSV